MQVSLWPGGKLERGERLTHHGRRQEVWRVHDKTLQTKSQQLWPHNSRREGAAGGSKARDAVLHSPSIKYSAFPRTETWTPGWMVGLPVGVRQDQRCCDFKVVLEIEVSAQSAGWGHSRSRKKIVKLTVGSHDWIDQQSDRVIAGDWFVSTQLVVDGVEGDCDVVAATSPPKLPGALLLFQRSLAKSAETISLAYLYAPSDSITSTVKTNNRWMVGHCPVEQCSHPAAVVTSSTKAQWVIPVACMAVKPSPVFKLRRSLL